MFILLLTNSVLHVWSSKIIDSLGVLYIMCALHISYDFIATLVSLFCFAKPDGTGWRDMIIIINNICDTLNVWTICVFFLLIFRDEYPILLVANKVDLVHLRKISESEGRAMADRLNLPYMETSAKDPPQNIDGAFHEVGDWCCVYL